ncbi:MAG: polysaccharide biosynthesis C-terminal domain-containing protein, partial [Oscillospiraceae bacterium]
GLQTVFLGLLVFAAFSPFMLKIKIISNYTILIFLYVAAAAVKLVCAQFVRSAGMVRLYAFDGFFATFTTIVFNILFLVTFKLGSTGYILSIILSNVVSVLFLFITAKLWKYVIPFKINKELRWQMIKYSLPIIPTTMFWWITTASDRFIITMYLGEAANGIYSAAHKLPGLLTIVSAVFYQAWQISAVTESGKGRSTNIFYSKVYSYYITMLFICCSGLIMVCRPITSVWLSQAFYDSWKYIPFLAIAEVFSSLVTFLGSFYMVSKNNKTVVLAIAAGAIANFALNMVFVPVYGAIGAAFATVISYLLAFFIRAVDILRFVNMDLKPLSVIASLLVLIAQTYLLFNCQWKMPILAQFLMFLVMCLVNLIPILRLLGEIFTNIIPKLRKKIE